VGLDGNVADHGREGEDREAMIFRKSTLSHNRETPCHPSGA
jgi:hypothetical protein